MKHDIATNGNGAAREHESLEEQLRTLMSQDEKARAEHDKLTGKLVGVDKEIAEIAAGKLELMAKLGGLYKKAAGVRKER